MESADTVVLDGKITGDQFRGGGLERRRRVARHRAGRHRAEHVVVDDRVVGVRAPRDRRVAGGLALLHVVRQYNANRKDNAADAFGRQRAANEVTSMEVVNHVSDFFKRGHRGAALQFPEHTKESYEAAARMGQDPTSCVYVGDDLRDVQAGAAAGMAYT